MRRPQAKRKRSSEDGQFAATTLSTKPTARHADEPSRMPSAAGSAREEYFKTLYVKPPDFKELGRLDPNFEKFLKGRDLDFNDPSAVMQLTKTLLKLDYDIRIELPDDRLCPPVANRHNYILWIKSLMDSTSYDAPGGSLVGLDIGTGASCIYPLLGCGQRPWSFIATDIDEKNLDYARENVRSNNLEGRINVVGRNPSSRLIPLDDLNIDRIDFCMNNPPFYASEDDMLHSASQKSRPPFTACSGAKVEMVTEGGEMAFVNRIFEESLVFRERVQWYSAMFGFLADAVGFLGRLKENSIGNYAVADLVQGNKTKRWVVAWSFCSMRPAESVARGVGPGVPRNLLPPATEVCIWKETLPVDIAAVVKCLESAVGGLELTAWSWDKERLEGLGRAEHNVWSRAWRRRKKKQQGGQDIDSGEPDNEDARRTHRHLALDKPCQLGFRVSMRVFRTEVAVWSRWLEGHEYSSFESFDGWLKTQLSTGKGSSTK